MQLFDCLNKLISIDTTSRNSNLPLIQALQAKFEEWKIPVRITYDSTKTKANLLASIADINENIHGGIVLSGHTDTVPVDGQEWHTNAFVATRIGDKVFGRGTSDMKGFLACMLSLVPEWLVQRPPHPVHLAFSYDEEVGCIGAPGLIADMMSVKINPKGCIVGEPTMMHPVSSHKGIQSFRCKVTGVAAHSSLTPQGCNAIDYAARLINFIRELANAFHAEGPFDKKFDVPYTTISTNQIHGGIASNIIPAECEFCFEFRHLPKVQPKLVINAIRNYVKDELLPEMKAEHEVGNIEILDLNGVPSFEADADSAFYKYIAKIADVTEIKKVAYATEAGQFQQAGIPTVVCGPGSIEQAHRANEFVEVEQLEQCQAFLRRVVAEFSNM